MTDTQVFPDPNAARLSQFIHKIADRIDPDIDVDDASVRSTTILFPGFDVNMPGGGSQALPQHLQEAIQKFVAEYLALPAQERPTIGQVFGRSSQTPAVDPSDQPGLHARRHNNFELSQRRIDAVRQALLDAGLSERDLANAVQVPAGESFPWFDHPDTEHVLNRSVELTLDPPEPQPVPPLPQSSSVEPWGTLLLDKIYTVNVLGIVLLVRKFAKDGLEAVIGRVPGLDKRETVTPPGRVCDCHRYVDQER